MKRGFAKDTSPAAQSRRGKKNKHKTPWRKGPACTTKRAKQSYSDYASRSSHLTQEEIDVSNANAPVYPVEVYLTAAGELRGKQTGNMTGWELGLTKREAFAMAAMQGLVPGPGPTFDYEAVAEHAVAYADALLAQLAKPATQGNTSE